MRLTIEGARSLQEVRQDFNAAYPYLMLEFFKPVFSRSALPSAGNMLLPSMKVRDARRSQHDGYVELEDLMKVAELERTFKELYGLNVQVFRKSGNIWLETTMTDGWTLKQQNDHGREISNSF